MDTFNTKKQVKHHLISSDFSTTQAEALLQFFEALLEVEKKNVIDKNIETNSNSILLKLENKLSNLKTDLMNWVITVSGGQVIIYIAAIISAIAFIGRL